jgi:hypothetical protein
VTRWQRPGAGEILKVYLLLATTGFVLDWLARGLPAGDLPPWILLTAFLTWRVSRGGRFSRRILIVVSVVSYAGAALNVARSWGLAIIALVVICAVQVTLLMSPPVYGHVQRDPIRVRAQSWARLFRRPAAWLLPCGLLAGVLVTLALLGNMGWATIPGCTPPASDACATLAEGYPLRWLTAYQNTPEISKSALLKDCAQWALAITSLLYLAWPWPATADESNH